MKAKAKAEAVRQRFEEGQAQHYHADGSKYYADEEHEQRLSALRTERNWELREIQEEANRAIEEAQADLAALTNGDPTTILSDTELQRANNKRQFVAEDVASLGMEALSKRIDTVARGGHRASMFAYLAASKRYVASNTSGSDDERTELMALAARLEAFEEQLRNGSETYTQKAQSAQERIEDAGGAIDVIYLARQGSNSPYVPNYAIRPLIRSQEKVRKTQEARRLRQRQAHGPH
jgi:hypothetical protein